MKTMYYLIEVINGKEYNIFTGKESECYSEMNELRTKYNNNNEMYVSCNRWD